MGEYKFSEALLSLLRETGTSNTALANFVGVKKPTVAGWLQGRDPSFKYVIKIKEYFGATFDELSGLEPISKERMREIKEHHEKTYGKTRRVEYVPSDKLTDKDMEECKSLADDAYKESKGKES